MQLKGMTKLVTANTEQIKHMLKEFMAGEVAFVVTPSQSKRFDTNIEMKPSEDLTDETNCNSSHTQVPKNEEAVYCQEGHQWKLVTNKSRLGKNL